MFTWKKSWGQGWGGSVEDLNYRTVKPAETGWGTPGKSVSQLVGAEVGCCVLLSSRPLAEVLQHCEPRASGAFYRGASTDGLTQSFGLVGAALRELCFLWFFFFLHLPSKTNLSTPGSLVCPQFWPNQRHQQEKAEQRHQWLPNFLVGFPTLMTAL